MRFFLFSVFVFVLVVNCDLNTNDRAFLDYVASLNPSSWTNPKTEYCSRRGVTCDESKSRLLGLDLRSQGLKDEFVHETTVAFLTSLNLASNRLTHFNVFPTPSLTSLNLSRNLLNSYTFQKNIPNVDLSSNELTSFSIADGDTLSINVSDNKKLTSLKVTNHPKLTTLKTDNNIGLRLLSLNNVPLIKKIAIDTLPVLGTLYITSLPALTALKMATIASLTDLALNNIGGRVQVESMINYYPQLRTLSVTNVDNAKLSISNAPKLTDLHISSMHFLTSLTITRLNELESIALYSIPSLSNASIVNNFALEKVVAEYVTANTLDLSSNALTSFVDSTSKANSNTIGELKLMGNMFQTIPEAAFNAARTIDLSSNGRLISLSYAPAWNTKLTRIDFLKCTNLGDVTLKNLNVLSVISPLSGFRMLSTVALSDITLLNSLSVSNLPALSSLFIYSAPITSLNITDTSSLGSLALVSTQMISVKDFSHPDSLTSLVLEQNLMRSIDILGYFPKLETLELHSLPSLSSLFLTSMPKLNNIIIDVPSVTSITYDSLDSIKQLNLSNFNQLNDVGLINMKEMNLVSINAVPLLYSIAIEHAPALNKLTISNTGMKFSNDLYLFDAPALNELNINNNKNLATFSISSLPGLESINLSNNGITSLSLGQLPNLTSIKVYTNTFLQSAHISDLASLGQAYIVEHSALSNLELRNLPSLYYLYLDTTSMSNISMINGLDELGVFVCKNCLFSSLASIQPPKSLGRLELVSNQLTTVDLTDSTGFRSLYNLNVLENPLTTLSIVDIPRLSDLSFPTLYLRSFTLKKLPSIKKLSLSGHSFDDVELEDLGMLTTLETLKLTGVYQFTLKTAPLVKKVDLSGVSHLRKLTLSDLPKLEDLTLTGSNYSDDINDFIKGLGASDLARMNLESNRFYGTFSETMDWRYTYNFPYNYISGAVPQIYQEYQKHIIGNCFGECGGIHPTCYRRQECSCDYFDKYPSVCTTYDQCKLCGSGSCTHKTQDC